MSPTESTNGFFGVKTLWTTILRIQEGDTASRQAALERLVTRYRPPIHRYLQTCWRPDWPESAEDLVQDFLARRLLAATFFEKVHPTQGRFRSYVKACLANFVREKLKEWGAAKRNQGRVAASLEAEDAEGRRLVDPASPGLSPDEALDRAWALNVLEKALQALGEEERRADNRGALFEALKGQLWRTPNQETAVAIGARLGMKESAVHTAMHRLRQRLGECIRAEILETVGSEEDWREELKYLIELLGRG